ncbi:DUF4256 domain-containing protein [Pseudoduganella rhizocola]|uniref:DUF4256 domain-containing protein n=1 Tax=Pseudoduganella rhizocola TaxID=3382643 RepID=UPI0038B585F4
MDELIAVLRGRFEKHMNRHPDLDWSVVQARLEARKDKLKVLQEMENTGGEPDVIGHDQANGELTFCDCSAETPAGRRSLCFDGEALAARKENKPGGSAVAMAVAIGITMLSEEQYRALQALGEFDRKTSSWVQTPASVRKLGGALFCDRRYGQVFVYHNGAESYYAARGFRGFVMV